MKLRVANYAVKPHGAPWCPRLSCWSWCAEWLGSSPERSAVGTCSRDEFVDGLGREAPPPVRFWCEMLFIGSSSDMERRLVNPSISLARISSPSVNGSASSGELSGISISLWSSECGSTCRDSPIPRRKVWGIKIVWVPTKRGLPVSTKCVRSDVTFIIQRLFFNHYSWSFEKCLRGLRDH